MTLLQFLTALAGNTNTTIRVLDSNRALVIQMNAAGYGSLNSNVSAKTVETVIVINTNEVEAILAADT